MNDTHCCWLPHMHARCPEWTVPCSDARVCKGVQMVGAAPGQVGARTTSSTYLKKQTPEHAAWQSEFAAAAAAVWCVHACVRAYVCAFIRRAFDDTHVTQCNSRAHTHTHVRTPSLPTRALVFGLGWSPSHGCLHHPPRQR